MSAPWLDSMTPIGPPTAAMPTIRQLMYAAVLTGSWSGILCLVVYLIGRLAGVPFEAANGPDAVPAVIPWLLVLLVPLAVAVVGTLLASLARGHRGAGRIVFWGGTLIFLLSCLAPITQPTGVLWSTRILLLIMHAITWALVVPQVARIVGDSEPGFHEERTD